MHPIRRTLLAALFAGGMLALAAAPVGAGVNDVTVAGTAACNPTTGQYDITWTLTSNQGSSGATITNATMTPPGSDLTASVSPNPIPGTTIPPGHSTVSATLPGSTSGVVTLTVTFVAVLTTQRSGTVTLDGQCTVAAVAVESPVDFTG